MVHYTKREVEYQLQGDWEIECEEYDDDSSQSKGGLYSQGRLGYSITDKIMNLLVHDVKRVTKGRINFDKNLIDLGLDSIKEYIVRIPDDIDDNGVRAFSIASSEIVDYYPAHTRTEEMKNGFHEVSFVVRENRENSSSPSKVKVGYTLDPNKKLQRKMEDPTVKFKFFCRIRFQDLIPIKMRITPPMKTVVELNGANPKEFKSPRNAERWISNKLSEISQGLS